VPCAPLDVPLPRFATLDSVPWFPVLRPTGTRLVASGALAPD
jgi:hypothetical protein